MSARIIYSNGVEKEVSPKNGKTFSLKEMNDIVGGFIEIVRTHDGDYMVINEEGKLQNLPLNVKATQLYQYGAHDAIVGDVLVCDTSMID